MFGKTLLLAGAAVAFSTVASAAVIPGPFLDSNDGGWTTAGLAFTANVNTTLTGFTFNSEGQDDTVVLTDSSGNVLHSIASAGGDLSVDWALSAGSTYWLLQTTASNARYAGWDGSAPSNADISIAATETFAFSISDAVHSGGNYYWAGFTNITTGSPAAVPEPASWAMMLGGFGLVGGAMRARRKTIAFA